MSIFARANSDQEELSLRLWWGCKVGWKASRLFPLSVQVLYLHIWSQQVWNVKKEYDFEDRMTEKDTEVKVLLERNIHTVQVVLVYTHTKLQYRPESWWDNMH